MLDVGIRSASDNQRLINQLKEKNARRILREELKKGTKQAAGPLPPAVLANLEMYLPDRYAAELHADLKINISVLAANPGVRLRGKSRTKRRRRFANINEGTLRHPLFGNRGFWFDQPVRPGFWSDPLRQQRDEVRQEVIAAMRRAADRIQS